MEAVYSIMSLSKIQFEKTIEILYKFNVTLDTAVQLATNDATKGAENLSDEQLILLDEILPS